MTIEVTIKLTKGHVFLTGESVECSISFSHQLSANHTISQSNSNTVENVAWGSVQIYCHCFTSPKVNKDNKLQSNDTPMFAGTSLAITPESGLTVFSTKPKILFCDLKLYPGQTKTYNYKEKIPNDAPPSYRGQLVKYCYKITVGTQRVNHPVKLLKVPIRVLPLIEVSMSDAGEIYNETTEELTPTNPFLEVRQNENPLNLALQTLQNITARRNPNFYMISNKRGKVARFCLFKPAYKLGEDIVGSLDFTVATVECMQLSVALQCQEEALGLQETKLHTFSRHHEVCFGFQHTQLVLPIPLHVTPAFTTKLVNLKWNLHFEFVTIASKKHETIKSPDNWQAPSEVAIETMVWTLPIRLYSTTPAYVAQGIQSNDIHTLFIR
ncbi:RAB6A-GEF complex partner protein 2 [Coccinella septempunctata]|uniref:RAB6A-GEF complex partner protein 2 n=1 Tax=Coccinella septempunctata TaxID=41139 RepID=UPI001D08D312|nr:RAB6A-GEF complex partner protein 2 [Coccinella septempunctata]